MSRVNESMSEVLKSVELVECPVRPPYVREMDSYVRRQDVASIAGLKMKTSVFKLGEPATMSSGAVLVVCIITETCDH